MEAMEGFTYTVEPHVDGVPHAWGGDCEPWAHADLMRGGRPREGAAARLARTAHLAQCIHGAARDIAAVCCHVRCGMALLAVSNFHGQCASEAGGREGAGGGQQEAAFCLSTDQGFLALEAAFAVCTAGCSLLQGASCCPTKQGRLWTACAMSSTPAPSRMAGLARALVSLTFYETMATVRMLHK